MPIFTSLFNMLNHFPYNTDSWHLWVLKALIEERKKMPLNKQYFTISNNAPSFSINFIFLTKKSAAATLKTSWLHHLNPFPHINAFGRLCSRRLFENIVTKEEIAQNVQFLLLPQCFPLLAIGYPFKYGDFLCFDKIRSKSSAAELS